MSGYEWLPPLIRLTEFGGDYAKYEEAIFERFNRDFKKPFATIDGREVRFAYANPRDPSGRDSCFWHLISKGTGKFDKAGEEERETKLDRCERIGWIRKIVERLRQSGVAAGWEVRKGKKRLLIALDDFSYVVILEARGKPPTHYFLITAYPISGEKARKKFAQIIAQDPLK